MTLVKTFSLCPKNEVSCHERELVKNDGPVPFEGFETRTTVSSRIFEIFPFHDARIISWENFYKQK